MNGVYARLDGKNVVPATFEQWREVFNNDKIVFRTDIGGFLVSTVFLGINFGDEQNPRWFETMIFSDKPNALDGSQWRCATWHEASVQHELAISIVMQMQSINNVSAVVAAIEDSTDCDHCGTTVESQNELTQTKWHGRLCETCMENRVWK